MSKGAPNLQGTEAAFQEQILELARLHGWLRHAERPAVSRSGRWATPIQGDAGFPDLVLVRGGRVLFWELKMKRGKGRLSPAQRQWADALTSVEIGAHGCVNYRVLTPADWTYIEEVLKEA